MRHELVMSLEDIKKASKTTTPDTHNSKEGTTGT
jgi:hypothetical protein